MIENLKAFLDSKVEQYNCLDFIHNDPVVIPHQFSVTQDIEIMGFFAAILAWGQRKTIINKCNELVSRMDGKPYDFVKNHKETDLKNLLGFKHRTFNDTDLLYFICFLKNHYFMYDSLEDAFIPASAQIQKKSVFRDDYLDEFSAQTSSVEVSSPTCYAGELKSPAANAGNYPLTIESYLNHFRAYFFSLPDFPQRTIKHVSSPAQKSTCKRLNMFLRWMVRKDDKGVDFGIWNKIKPSQLICPCDVHVDRVARKLNLITRKQTDWLTATELTARLAEFDPSDPVRYDFALFGLGIEEKF